jgi:glycosyltransferase involved in cell wall biosynthesis
MNRKTVAIVGTRGYPSYYGGFETAVRKLAPYLVDHGWDVTVYSRPGAVAQDDPARDLRVKTVYTAGLETRSLSTLSYGLTAFIDIFRKKPDVVLVMNVANGFFLPIARLRGVPTAVNVDGMEWKRAKWGKMAKAVFRMGAGLTAKHADSLIADSREIARQWKQEFGVDSTFIPYGGEQLRESEPPMGLERGSYVLLVARFVPENTIQPFFDAVPEIAKRYPVVLIGSDGQQGMFDQEASRLDRDFENVHWLGHVSDDSLLHALWQNCGVYFHGHTVGGTNPSLVQAMMLGAPIVAIDTVFSREVLGSAGGVLTERDPTSIAGTLDLVLENDELRARLTKDAQLRAEQQYSWASINERYDSLLSLLVQRISDRRATTRKSAGGSVRRRARPSRRRPAVDRQGKAGDE